MSLFKKLKNVFVVDDEEFKKKMQGGNEDEKIETSSNSPKSSSPSPRPTTSTTSSPSSVPSPGKASSKFTDILLRSMEANNLDGFDYLEYKQSLHNLAKMPMERWERLLKN